MKVETIVLDAFASDSLKICLIQIESPFDDMLAKTWRPGGHFLGLTDNKEDKYRHRIVRLRSILETLQKSGQAVDVLVLPEYAYLKNDALLSPDNTDTLDYLSRFAETSKTVVVGNRYDTDKRLSETFTIIPSSHFSQPHSNSHPAVLSSFKITRSRYDNDILADLSPEMEKVIRLEWSSAKNRAKKVYLQVLTCKDYLYFTSLVPLRQYPEIIRLDTPGIIVCPASTPEMHSFETRAMAMTRDVDLAEGDMSVVTCICNTTSLESTCALPMCGQTQVISPLDMRTQIKPLLRKGVEGCVLAEVNLFRSQRQPTPTNTKDGGAVLTSSQVLQLTHNPNGSYGLSPISDSKRSFARVINPAYLAQLGLRRVYGFLRCTDYHSFKRITRARHTRFPSNSISVHGIYGIHDVLAGSWEEFTVDTNARNFMKMRLWPMLSSDKRQMDDSHFGCCIVKRFWKYRGIRLDAADTDVQVDDKMREPAYRHSVRQLMLGEAVDGRLLKELTNNRVVLETKYDLSDLSVQESNAGLIEYLVLIKLVLADTGPFVNDARREFEKTVMDRLLSDERVRTIEEINAEGLAFVDADYVLHVVGELGDLNDIVLGVIHDHTPPDEVSNRFKCGTRVVIPAETVTSDNFPALDEANKQSSTEPNVLTVVDAWKRIAGDSSEAQVEILLPVIFSLDDDSARKIIQSYFLADRVNARGRKENAWMNDFFMFAYEVCWSLSPYQKSPKHSRNWRHRCNSFVTALAQEVESEMARLCGLLANVLGFSTEQFNQLVNATIEALTGKPGRFDCVTPELGTCAFALEKMASILNQNREQQRIKVIELVAPAKATLTPELAKSGLDRLVELSKRVVLSDIVRELQAFASARNDVIHHRGKEEVSGASLLEGTFFGLRMLDRVSKLSDKLFNSIRSR